MMMIMDDCHACSLFQMCMMMIILFITCWTPYTFISLAATFDVPLPPSVTTLPTMFAKLSCALNPIIYAFMSR